MSTHRAGCFANAAALAKAHQNLSTFSRCSMTFGINVSNVEGFIPFWLFIAFEISLFFLAVMWIYKIWQDHKRRMKFYRKLDNTTPPNTSISRRAIGSTDSEATEPVVQCVAKPEQILSTKFTGTK